MGLNAVSERGNRIYLGIAHGQVRRRAKDGSEEFYRSVEGTFKGIVTRESEYNGTPLKYYDIILADGQDEYVLSVNRATSVARSIILHLASLKSFGETPIRIEPWNKTADNGKEYTNVSVYAAGEKIRWVTSDLPEAKSVTVGSVVVRDDSELVEFVQRLADGVNAVLQREQAAPFSELDDMPE